MDNLDRYQRQTSFELIGEEGQRKLLKSKVLIIGIGALGSVIANNLCRAGVGFLRIIDRDIVETVNLSRQVLFTEEDAAKNLAKAEAALSSLSKVNSEVEIEAISADVNATNIERFIDGMDLVVDGTDNFETRFLINEACDKHKVKWVYGGALASSGAVMNILQDGGPCFRCFMPEMPAPGSYPTCTTMGVVNPITNIVAAYETAEAMKILTGSEDVSKSYLAIDVWENLSEYIEIEKNPECPVCVKKDYELLDNPNPSAAISLCGHRAYQIIPKTEAKIDFEEFAAPLKKLGGVSWTKFSLGFKNKDASFKIFPDGRAIINNVDSEEIAKEIYAEYIGS